MKKLISSIIIILPLLLLAILLVSGAIVSFLTHVYVEKVEFSNNEAIVLVMDDEQYPPTHNLKDDITILPLKATNRDLVYTNYDSSLLQISDDGVITPLFYGETYVTVQSRENAAATATRKVIVTDVSVHALRFNDYAKDMYQGETAQLSVAVYPQQAQNKAVNWSSSDSSILQVSSNGTVTSLGNGTATVTATSVDNPSVQVTATINCHAKLKGLVFDNSLFQTSLTTARFPAVTSDPAKCDFTLQYACDNTDIADVDQSGNITFKREGKVTVTVTGTDYKGNTVQGQKTFVSTFGYFIGPLFDVRALKYEDCQVGEALPLNFVPKLEGSYQLIKTIEYAIDDTVTSGEGQTGLIEYDETNKQFVLKQSFPEFNGFIEVVVHATVYDNATNTLNSTYEDYFRIEKHEITEKTKVYRDDVELTAGGVPNDIVVEDIGGNATLTIDNPDNLRVQINSTQNVTAVRDGNTVTLTGKLVCEGEVIQLSIGTKVYNLRVIVHAKAQRIDVKYGGEPMTDGETYRTLLNKLTFAVQSGRDDNQTVTNPVKYQLNNTGTWHEVSDGSATLSVTSDTTVQFLCDDIQFTLYLSKVTLEDFGFEASYTKSDGAQQSLSALESVNGHDSWSLTLPSDIQNTVTFQLKVANLRQYLGGFGTDDYFQTLFPIELPADDGWDVNHNATVGQIVVGTPSDFNKTLKLGYNDGANEISIHLFKVNIQAISFGNGDESYDSSKPEDVHKGYQQVRVFAKHSYYDGKQVDYFRIPLNALSNVALQTPASVDTISWTLSRYVGSASTKVLVTQLGDAVTIDSQVYKVVPRGGEYVLQDVNGNAVSGVNGLNRDGYVWVDVYTEKEQGYARIYFGNFNGLREVDVQNDYFGNFDDKPTWTQPQQVVDDNSGRAFDISAENSFTFLRVEAGDGVEGGKNCHFNFNVLDDTTLVNVFDATGYYENSKIVLHENLYGVGELGDSGEDFDKATEKGLFLTKTNTPWNSTDSTVLGKTTVYGNGYQINLQAKNEALKTAKPEEKNNSWGVSFGNLYNVFVKGANPEETVNVLRQKIVLIFTNAYYCDLQGYTKGRPQNNQTAYIKNTVLHSASQSAFQLFYTGEKAYLENVTVVECAAGITNEQRASEVGADHETNFYFKGNIDVLNYTNVRGVTNMAAGAVSDQSLGMLSGALTSVNDHFEWFGFNCTSDQFNTYNMPYFNLVIYTSNRKGVFNFWNGTSYVKSEDDILYKCSKCGATSANNQFCEMCFQGEMMPAFNYSYGAPEGGAPMKMVLDLSDYKSYLDGSEVTAWTYNYPKVGNKPVIHNGQEATYKVTVDGRLPNMSGTSFQYYRYMFTEERYIRLLCQYVNATDDGTTLVKNDDHILWHIQQAYRDKSLLTGRNHDHMAALRESLTGKNITWPDNTTPEQAMKEYDEYQAQLAATARA